MKRAVFLGTSIVSTSLVERRSEFDPRELESALGRPAQVKQMWENVALRPGVFGNIKNALNGLIFGYGYAPGAIAMAVVNHGPSSAYTYDDSIWTKYRVAEFLGYQQPSYDNPFASAAARVAQSLGLSHPGGAPLKNTFYARRNPLTGPSDPDDEKSPYQDTSIEALQRRGVAFLLCHTAVVEQARALVRSGYAPAGMTAREVCKDILTHLVRGTIVVPSGVATIAVLQQRYGYSYITIQS